MNGETIDIHTESDGVTPGSRWYIHARNLASAILFILEKFKPGDRVNITGKEEINNLEMAQKIADVIGKPLKYNLINFHSTRPGHDIRYGLSGEKLYNMGWEPPVDFEKSLRKTVEWTLAHPHWYQETSEVVDTCI